ncbi:hypothetical protein GALL_550040 [mine drainage metagenome]|uniref:Uncharacterized protein n=1 Tax=mine drainage metagenome TaxID=410659 RepID=A0A1J5P6N6_9ZZZZ
MFARQPQDHRLIQRLGKPCICHGQGNPALPQGLCRDQNLCQTRAERQHRNARSLSHDPPAPDLQRHALRRHLDAHTLTARKPEGRGAVINRCRRRHHVDQLRLVRGGHHHHTRQVRHEGDVKRPGMGRAIRPDQPRPINRKAHRQPLDRHIMHHLIVAALQKRRVNRAERLHPRRGQSGRKCHRVLLGDSHIKAALGEAFSEQVKPGAIRHRRRDRHDLAVGLCLADQALRENLGVGRRVGNSLGLLASQHVELRRSMALVARCLGGGIDLALLGQHMDEDRPRCPRLQRAQ